MGEIEMVLNKKNEIESVVERKENEYEEEEDERKENEYGREEDQPWLHSKKKKKEDQQWRKQITVRAIVASLLIGIVYSVICLKLNLTTGLVPNLNISSALLAFLFIKTWTKVVQKSGFIPTPFTRQENTIAQTCAVACYSISLAGGFASYLIGLNRRTFELTGGVNTEGNNPSGIKEPSVAWMTPFLFVTSFIGLVVLVPLGKVMIIDYKLTFPSGRATAVLIDGFHSSTGDMTAETQIQGFIYSFGSSLFWAFFRWFYSGGEGCGFSQFPTFGLQAWKKSFFFDFNMTYVGAGMISSHLVNLSLLFGAILSWGIMWPLIAQLKGQWFPATLPESSMKSLNGYKVFICIALILGDGLYNFIKSTGKISHSTLFKTNSINTGSDVGEDGTKEYERLISENEVEDSTKESERLISENEVEDSTKESQRPISKNKLFVRESVPFWMACVGYLFFSVVSIIVIPLMFPQLKWYFVLVAYLLAPILSFCNAYGAGLTDMNMAYRYGEFALFVMAGLSGKNDGVVAGMVACGLIKSIVSVSADLMHDFKTGHLTRTSPRSMLVAQAIGTAIGCVVAPLTFFLFYKAFDVGNPDGEYKAPYAVIYRNMAILGVQGLSALPAHCLELCYGFFAFAVVANLARDLSPKKIGELIPLPMAMAVPFLVGGSFAIDMCIGSLVVFIWEKVNRMKADVMVPAVASGLICGDGLWILPSSLLALAKVKPPMCMNFTAAH